MAEAKPPQYFEGTLQLRDCPKKVIDFVREQVEKDPYAHIAKEKKLKNGLDLYLSSNKFMRKLGRVLRQKFGGIISESVRLYSRDRMTSREMYRVTVLFKMVPFKVGDVIDFRGEKQKVMAIKEKITLKNISTGKNKLYRYRDVTLH